MAKGILVVDDATFIRQVVKDIFIKNGYNVLGEAKNGLEAIEQYKILQPELVLMDITMPELNGIEAVKEIRKNDANACIIMCSAMGQQAMVIEAIKAGARDFIVKPFEEKRIISAAKKVLGY